MTATTEAPTLAERLEAARQAEAGPRQRVAELQAALRAAEERRDWPEVTRLEGELQPEREALAFASAVAEALASQAATIERERQERNAARVKAEQVAQAQTVLGEAVEEEQAARAQIGEHVDWMYDYLRAARHAFGEAQEAERAVKVAQQKAISARVVSGETAAPGPRAPGANAASVLKDRDRLVAELVKWAGPAARPTPRPVITTSAPPQGARGLTQQWS